MLQQTTVAAVVPYFQRFLARFPDVTALALANESEVLAHWAGLGYYARARNLQGCARAVRERFGGQFPADVDALLTLPGVGRYTAGAVASIAFGLRAPIVDANVARVLARVFLLEGDAKSKAVNARLWEEAEHIVSVEGTDPALINPGLMELGALVCSPRDPACGLCPVAAWCGARREGRQAEIPAPMARPEVTPLHDVCALARKNISHGPSGSETRVLLRRRPDLPGTWWRGMWELPRTTLAQGETPAQGLVRLAAELQMEWEPGGHVSTVNHGVTRYAIRLDCHEVTAVVPGESEDFGWFSHEEAAGLPLPSSMKRLVKVAFSSPAAQLNLL